MRTGKRLSAEKVKNLVIKAMKMKPTMMRILGKLLKFMDLMVSAIKNQV